MQNPLQVVELSSRNAGLQAEINDPELEKAILESLIEETKENVSNKIVTARPGTKMNVNYLGSKNDDDLKCIICLDRRSNTFLAPCLHRDFCDRCAKRLMEFPNPKCPLCKTGLAEIRMISK